MSKFDFYSKDPVTVGPNDLIIKNLAIGVGFEDIMYRRGSYILPTNILLKNLILGFEGVGIIEQIGSEVKSFKIGDRVAYAFCRFGAYAEKIVLDYRFVFHVPNRIPDEIIVGTIRKALLADCLLFKAFRPFQGDWILIHSIAGGTGHIMAKWAKFVGLNVIGTVSDDSKISIGMATGCQFIINRKKEDFVQKIMEITNGYGVRAVYDGIGKDVFEKNIEALMIGGIYISYGYISGAIENINSEIFRKKCLFFTTPRMELYKHSRYELLLTVENILDLMEKNILIPTVSKYNIDNIQQLHRDMESGRTIGSMVVIPI